MFDYKSCKEWPLFQVDYNLYPNKDQQTTFLSAYIDAVEAAQKQSTTHENGTPSLEINRDELLKQLMKEANYFTLAAHFFWTLWAIHMATSTTIKFGYMVKEKLFESF
jgi:hypothetical protein